MIPYFQCKNIIKEADVLLFQCGRFPGIGWWIATYSQSPYSHVGLAHWENEELYCLEFREFKGARKVLMDDYVKECKIDVFRPYQKVIIPTLTGDIHKTFTPDIAQAITTDALKLINSHQPYGWKIIWQIARTYTPFARLWNRPKYKDTNGNLYVCSTLITKTYRKHFIDPVDFLSDEYTKPGDIARANIFYRLFTIAT